MFFPGYVVLQNRKCLGELRPHRIRLQKGPYKPPKRLIEEVPGSSKNLASGDSVNIKGKETREDSNYAIPKYRLIQKPDGLLVGEFYLPNIVSTKMPAIFACSEWLS